MGLAGQPGQAGIPGSGGASGHLCQLWGAGLNVALPCLQGSCSQRNCWWTLRVWDSSRSSGRYRGLQEEPLSGNRGQQHGGEGKRCGRCQAYSGKGTLPRRWLEVDRVRYAGPAGQDLKSALGKLLHGVADPWHCKEVG